MVVFDPTSSLDDTARRRAAFSGGPAVTLPYSGVPLSPAPAGAGVIPARPRESDYPFSPLSPNPATSAGVGGSRGISGGPMVTMPYSGTTLGPPPAGTGVIPASPAPRTTPSLPDWEYAGTPYRAPVPTAPAGGGAGGGGGGGGGGGAAGGAVPGGGSAASWQQLMEQQRSAASQARANLDREFQTRSDQLRQQYEFAETEQEKAQLAFLMAELDAATQRADQAILAGYANAVENIQMLGARTVGAAGTEAQAVQNLFLTAGDRFAGQIADVQQRTGLQAGLAGTAFAPGEDFMGLLAADAAREAALTQRLGGIVSEEMTDAERRMAFQQASQQADLQRQSASSGAQTRADQQAAVAARIAADRRNFTDNLRQLQSTYANIGASFDQAGIQSYGQQAELAQGEALFLANLASQERRDAAARSARMSELEAQWSREDASRQDWQTPELAQALLRWDTMTDIQKARPGAYEEVFGGVLPGVTAPTPTQPRDPRDFPRPSTPARPLVPTTDEEVIARAQEIERARQASAQVDAARNYYRQQLGTLQQWENQGLIPRGTAEQRARQATEERYPGVRY